MWAHLDHHIHYYDLRNLKNELFTFKGHAKAVSYVRFLSATELVSAYAIFDLSRPPYDLRGLNTST